MGGNWTSWEKRIYKLIRNRKLGPNYTEMDLPVDNPSKRLIYVNEKLSDKKDGVDINKSIKRYGRPITLMRLENKVIKKFF